MIMDFQDGKKLTEFRKQNDYKLISIQIIQISLEVLGYEDEVLNQVHQLFSLDLAVMKQFQL